MNATEAEQRTCAILGADVVGYSRLMAADERATYERLVRLRATEFGPRVAAYGGTLIKHTGDGSLVIFDNARSAIACALEIQRAIAAAESGEAPNRRISLRIGVNVGDVIVDGGDIYGDAVNIAARLQTYAEPGGIAVTGGVEAQIGADPMIRIVDLGNLYLHNMARPVRMFTLHVNGADVRLVGDAPLGTDNRPSIAVLPFRKYQKDPEEAYFADGIVEDIIYALAGLKELFVVSRGSSLGYGGDAVDTRAIGQALGNGPLAVERAERGVRLAPQDPFRFWHEALLGQAHYVNGNFGEAVVWARRAVGRNGAVAFSLRTLVASLMALGKTDEAAAAVGHLLRVQPAFQLSRYEKRCPFQGEVLATWIGRLRAAGLPD